MKVEFIKNARADGVDYKKDAVETISDMAAEKLLRRGFVKKWKPAKKVKVDGPASGE